MHPAMTDPTTTRAPDDAGADTRAAIDGGAAPRLPSERDESGDSTSDKPDARMGQAHDDLASGRKDTDRSGLTDDLYGKTLRGG